MTTNINTDTFTPIAGIARSAILVDLFIAVYSGRKQDKRTQEEVTNAKGAASKRAASVYKSLFAECRELDDINKFQARARQMHYKLTLPWSDSGTRIIPVSEFTAYKETMSKYEEEFYDLVGAFLDKYDTLVAAAAFQLGTLFDRREYLTREQVRNRFSFNVATSPLPTAGDFRLDIEAEVQQDLVDMYEKRMSDQVAKANQDAWTRLYEVLARMSDRLTVDEDGKKRKFHDTLVSNAEELCDLLTRLNVAGDPSLERARGRLQDALVGVSPDALRKEDSTRTEVKQKVDAILSDFDWGTTDDEE
jgi:hypothetical protein